MSCTVDGRTALNSAAQAVDAGAQTPVRALTERALDFDRYRGPSSSQVVEREQGCVEWWVWGKVVGAIGLVALIVSVLAGHVPHKAIVVVILHVAVDFTFQSHEVATRKGERGWHLLCHALVSGGIPLAITGLMTGSPATVLAWIAISVIGHYAVDWSRKFGLQDVALAIISDQACHLLIILALVLSWDGWVGMQK